MKVSRKTLKQKQKKVIEQQLLKISEQAEELTRVKAGFRILEREQEQQEERYKKCEKRIKTLLLKVEDTEVTNRVANKMIDNLNRELKKKNEKLFEQIIRKRELEEENFDLKGDICFMRLQRAALLVFIICIIILHTYMSCI